MTATDPQAPTLEAEASGGERALARALRLLALAIAATLALRGLGEAHLFGDEFHSVRRLGQGYLELWSTYDRFGSGLLLPLLQKLCVDVLGAGLLTYRLPALLGALATLLLAYPTARFLLRPVPAALLTLVLAANPAFVFYARYGRAYSLAAACALLFLWGLLATLERGPAADRGARRAAVALGGGLLPFAHLYGAVLAASAGLVALLLHVRRPQRRVRELFVPLAVGALLAVGLHLPALDTLTSFTEEKTFAGSAGPLDALHVGTVLYGCRTSAWLALGAAVLGLVLAWRGGGGRAAVLLVGTAALAPALGLLVTRPAGMPFAYARYLVPSLAFQLVLIVVLLDRLTGLLARRMGRPGWHAGLTAVLGLVGVGVHFACGPLGVERAPGGPFANANLALVPLPAFDEPWPGASPFYARLAASDADVTVIEAPELWNRSQLLYRNHWLAHEKRLLSGVVFERDPAEIPAGFTVDLHDPEAIRASGASYLILHTDIYRELANYWVFVERLWERDGTPDLEPHMAAHANPGMQKDRLDKVLTMAEELEATLGPPDYRDAHVSVWALR